MPQVHSSYIYAQGMDTSTQSITVFLIYVLIGGKCVWLTCPLVVTSKGGSLLDFLPFVTILGKRFLTKSQFEFFRGGSVSLVSMATVGFFFIFDAAEPISQYVIHVPLPCQATYEYYQQNEATIGDVARGMGDRRSSFAHHNFRAFGERK